MIYHSIEDIEKKVKEIWAEDLAGRYDSPELKIQRDKGEATVKITLSRMYEAPGLTFQQMMALSEFFGTKNINDDDRFSWGGCETCDYGSEYGFTLTVRPEK